MSAFNTFQTVLEKYIGPVAAKLGQNRVLRSLTAGMMGTMPVTLGVALISIAINLPIPGWSEMLATSGASLLINCALTVTMSSLAIYLVVCIAYNFGKELNLKGTNAAVMAMGVFLVLMPIEIQTENGTAFMINAAYLGSKGIFVGMVIGIVVPAVLAWLLKRVELKLPDSVPPIVGTSLQPTFAAIIIFTVVILMKVGFAFTPWGSIFDMVNEVVAAPIMNVGSSVWAPIVVRTLACTLWFFGVHPSAISSMYTPVITACTLANTEAFVAGEPLPYLDWAIMNFMLAAGGTTEGIGLLLSSLTAKSERYKMISRLGAIPGIFNITEPLMFGLPAVLNPMYFFPMVLIKPVVGLWTLLMITLGVTSTFNPTISMPWSTPTVITAFMQGGLGLFITAVGAVVLAFLLYLPFFKMLDKQALAEEAAAEAEPQPEE